MTRKLITIIICVSVFYTAIPGRTFGFTVPEDVGTGTDPAWNAGGGGLSCVGPLAKVVCILKNVYDVIQTTKKIMSVLSYVPHSFPFGGPILSSERACEFHLRVTTWTGWILPFVGWVPIPAPIPLDVPLVGRAIEVGPPVPTNGKVIAFPWISKIYKQHSENRVGPWALGLGFSPFPLRDINDALGEIHIWIPPTLIDRSCLIPDFSWYGRTGLLAVCVDDISFECKASGEKDASGNDIYKVIRLLGTSP